MGRGSKDSKIICGVDEVGRGPLAGPVVAAAVILDAAKPIDDLADSKLLSPAKRQRIYSHIIENAAGYAVAGVSCDIIDKVNILQATFMAMRKAIESLPIMPDKIYVDGCFKIPGLDIEQEAIIGGDRLIAQVSAASIVAKVTRDTYMVDIAKMYPDYGFDKHKGYGTDQHRKALKKHGHCRIHRKSFRPVSSLIKMLT